MFKFKIKQLKIFKTLKLYVKYNTNFTRKKVKLISIFISWLLSSMNNKV